MYLRKTFLICNSGYNRARYCNKYHKVLIGAQINDVDNLKGRDVENYVAS